MAGLAAGYNAVRRLELTIPEIGCGTGALCQPSFCPFHYNPFVSLDKDLALLPI